MKFRNDKFNYKSVNIAAKLVRKVRESTEEVYVPLAHDVVGNDHGSALVPVSV